VKVFFVPLLSLRARPKVPLIYSCFFSFLSRYVLLYVCAKWGDKADHCVLVSRWVALLIFITAPHLRTFWTSKRKQAPAVASEKQDERDFPVSERQYILARQSERNIERCIYPNHVTLAAVFLTPSYSSLRQYQWKGCFRIRQG